MKPGATERGLEMASGLGVVAAVLMALALVVLGIGLGEARGQPAGSTCCLSAGPCGSLAPVWFGRPATHSFADAICFAGVADKGSAGGCAGAFEAARQEAVKAACAYLGVQVRVERQRWEQAAASWGCGRQGADPRCIERQREVERLDGYSASACHANLLGAEQRAVDENHAMVFALICVRREHLRASFGVPSWPGANER